MKSQPTAKNTTSSTSIDQWLSGAAQHNVANAGSLPAPTPYTGQGTAGLTPAQLQAIQLAMHNAGSGTDFVNSAAGGATNAMNFNAPQVSTGDIGAGIQGLLNPYVGAQVTSATDEINRQRDMTNVRNESAAAANHAWGGDRAGVVQAENDRNADVTKNNAITGLLGNAYNTALSTSTGVVQGNQNASIAGAGVNLAGANALGGLGPLLKSLGISDVNSLLQTGGVQQSTDQAGKTFNYQDFLRQIQQQQQNQNAATQAIGSAPHGTTGNSTETSQIYSNPLAGVLGAGLGIAGLMSGNPMALSGIGGLLGTGPGSSSGVHQMPSQAFMNNQWGW